MSLAHVGLGITIIGVTISSLYSTEKHESMNIGDSIELSGYTYQFTNLRKIDGPNYSSYEGEVRIFKDNKQISILKPEKRIYTVRSMPMTEAGIDAGLTRDFYVSLGEPLEGGTWSVRLYYKPFVRWIWLGAIFMALGGLLVVSDKRYRFILQRVKNSRDEAIADSGSAIKPAT